MAKGEKTGLGRALVKHHNQMIQQSKEKGKYYRSQQKKVLESVTEVSDIDAVIEQADEASTPMLRSSRFNCIFSVLSCAERRTLLPKVVRRHMRKEVSNRRKKKHCMPAVFGFLAGTICCYLSFDLLMGSSMPKPFNRPPWNAKMSVEELDDNEKRAFLEWRRSLARLEENENLVLTPFEKNLDIWRQLWRVLERSDLLVMVVDARDPLFYRCPDLEAYAQEIDEHKRTLLLVNKADLLPFSVREKWAKYFHEYGILFVFWSAKAASAALEGKKLSPSSGMQSSQQESANVDTKVHGRDELLARLQSEAEEIVSMRNPSRPNDTGVVVGFVGYPNVGKSSTINALVGEKRTGVTSTPGKTKHFQTLIITEKLTLCDCPGLVFPSFTSSRYEMIASGVLPIDRMTEHREALQVVASRVPRSDIEDVYRISLPKPKPYEPQSRPPSAVEFLRTYCASRGYVASSGLPDETRAARQILKDYIDGKLPHFEMPPEMSGGEDDAELSPSEGDESGSSEDDEDPMVGKCEPATGLEHVLNDLNSFDMDNGLASAGAAVKKASIKPHKQHKKPQRKKDRTWRVRDNESDGMPVVRVFQKPVSRGSLNA